jgi:hypothetical protein
MRLIVGCIAIIGVLSASDNPTTFFQKSETNQLLCRESEYAYRLVSQKNAEIVTLHDHKLFKLQGENLYLIATGCTPLTGKKEAIVF